MPEVKLKDVVKTFDKGRIIAVDHVNLTVHDKEYLTLLGPSGCGKSVLLRLIAGLEVVDSGSIYVFNKEVKNGRR